MKDNLKLIIFTILIYFFINWLYDYSQNEEINNQLYCEMVDIWNIDKNKDIPIKDRGGWPPFKNWVNCD